MIILSRRNCLFRYHILRAVRPLLQICDCQQGSGSFSLLPEGWSFVGLIIIYWKKVLIFWLNLTRCVIIRLLTVLRFFTQTNFTSLAGKLMIMLIMTMTSIKLISGPGCRLEWEILKRQKSLYLFYFILSY